MNEWEVLLERWMVSYPNTYLLCCWCCYLVNKHLLRNCKQGVAALLLGTGFYYRSFCSFCLLRSPYLSSVSRSEVKSGKIWHLRRSVLTLKNGPFCKKSSTFANANCGWKVKIWHFCVMFENVAYLIRIGTSYEWKEKECDEISKEE